MIGFHYLLILSKPSSSIYYMSQSELKWGRCERFTKMSYFLTHWGKMVTSFDVQIIWIQTIWVRKYTQQAFQWFKPHANQSLVVSKANPQSSSSCDVYKRPLEEVSTARSSGSWQMFLHYEPSRTLNFTGSLICPNSLGPAVLLSQHSKKVSRWRDEFYSILLDFIYIPLILSNPSSNNL